MTDKQQGKKGPVLKMKRGSIEAAVFENEKEGKVWHNVSIYRRYKSSSGEYRETSTYAVADLVQVIKLAEQAESWINQRLNQAEGEMPTIVDENI